MTANGWKCTHDLLDKNQVHYCEYTSLATLIGLLRPNASSGNSRDFEHPDEVQFLLLHQIFEIAFQLHITELRRLITTLTSGDLVLSAHILSRIIAWTKIYSSLILLMNTMKPSDFGVFREKLAPASGAESEATRVIELLSGIRPDSVYAEDRGRKFLFKQALDRAPQEGLYTPKARWWTDNLYQVAQETDLATAFDAQLSKLRISVEEITSSGNQELIEFTRLLRQYDRVYTAYREAHVTVVTRQIGDQAGTGHTSGVTYLASIARTARFFPKLTGIDSPPKDTL